jgi:hypothetical protein
VPAATIEWGTEARVRELLGSGVTELTAQVLSTDMCGISQAVRVEFNRTYVGPTKAVFDRLCPDAQQALAAELASCLQASVRLPLRLMLSAIILPEFRLQCQPS